MFRTLTLNLAKYFPSLLKEIDYVPEVIVFSLTYRCNLRCVMCNYWNLPTGDEISTDEVKDIIKQAKEIGIKACLFYGGEPMLREDIYELVGYAHKIGLKTVIISNGTLLDKERARKLIESGLNKISISMDTTGAEEDKIRGVKGSYERAYQGLCELVKLRENHDVSLRLASVLMLPTLRDQNIIKTVELAKELRVPISIQLLDFSLFYYQGVGDKRKKELWITEDYQRELDLLVNKLIKIKKESPEIIVNSIPALNYIRGYFIDPKVKKLPCYIAYSGRIWIETNKKVFLCQGLSYLGDLNDQTLREIVYSDKWKKRLRDMFEKKCHGCSCMYSSNVDAHIPFAYKEMILRKISNKGDYV